MSRLFLHLFFLLSLMLPAMVSRAALVEIGGEAPVHSWDLEQARRAALKDAVVRASELGPVSGAARLMQVTRGSGELPMEGTGYRIVSQEVAGDWVYLVVELDVGTGVQCEQLSHYRKKVAVTAFPMVRVAQGRRREVSFLEQGVPRELGRRLEEQRLYRVTELAPRHPFTGVVDGSRALNRAAVDPAVIAAIGEEQGVQAVVAGIIRDAAIEYGTHYEYETPIGDKPFSTGDDARTIELEVMVYDAASGALLEDRTFREKAAGEVLLETDSPSGLSRAFLDSDFGRAVDRLLRHAALTVDFALACRPFMARVVRVEGDDIYIDAGLDAAVKKGDRFNALITTRDAFAAGAGAPTLQEVPAGTLTVVKSEPGFSIGRIRQENAIRPGDLVREP
ncbi:flagella assembly protein FlgT middle domain-containing protein [Endothiovibrio diazotrophicus]